jgi:hypothetical protein
VSEELDEWIEMARTIRMTPEQGIPRLERRETLRLRSGQAMGHPRRSFGYGNTRGPSTSLWMTGLGTGLTGRAEWLSKRSERAE